MDNVRRLRKTVAEMEKVSCQVLFEAPHDNLRCKLLYKKALGII